jgi:hypothetical protein
VVFLIGMRINRPLKFHRWIPVFSAMPRMVRELEQHPELGFLGAHSWLGRTTIMLQYWDSFEKLEAYARAKNHAHLPAWREFNRRIGTSGDVGVWHETYLLQPGSYEAIYSNMPRFGLSRFAAAGKAEGWREQARHRLRGKAD